MTAYYPISLLVVGKLCVVVGGGEVAARKVLALLEAGATVSVVSPDLVPGLRALSLERRVKHLARSFVDADLAGAFLAIAATDDATVNHAVFAAARRQGILVNVVDDPDRSDFNLPAVVRRGDLLVAVSTNGRSPAIARRVRDDLQTFLTDQHIILLDLAAGVRQELRARGQRPSGAAWQRALDDELMSLIQSGDLIAAHARLIARLGETAAVPVSSPVADKVVPSHPPALTDSSADLPAPPGGDGHCQAPPSAVPPAVGFVSLVGAGPGDPGLITARGLDRLRAAEVVVYDRLVDDRLLAEAPAGAELIYVGKVASRHTMRQTQINALLVKIALSGRRVVRLKGGDPFVFGRGAEEALDLAAAGIPFEVVPGVTAAVAVPAYAGIPLTHRQCASSFAVITGHEDPAKPVSQLDWSKLATAVDTLVCLMSVQNLPHIVAALVRHGRPADTPVALIRWGTWPAQETLVGTLADIVSLAAERQIEPPVVAVIGEVVRLRDVIRWFDESTPAYATIPRRLE